MTGLYVADGYGAVADANLVNLRWSRRSDARACASIYPVALTSPRWRSAHAGTVAGDFIARGISVNFTVRLAASWKRYAPGLVEPGEPPWRLRCELSSHFARAPINRILTSADEFELVYWCISVTDMVKISLDLPALA